MARNHLLLSDLTQQIKQIYLNKNQYQMQKVIVDFNDASGTYLGDYFNLFIMEGASTTPTFYHIGGPFDLVSKKTPQRATVYRNGELLVNQDITEEVNMRTAAMNFVVLSELGIDSLQNKKVLIVGTGGVAKRFLRYLKEFDQTADELYYTNTRGYDEAFEKLGQDIGIDCKPTNLDQIDQFDIIVLVTSARSPIITSELFQKIKPGALITSFVAAQGEIAPENYSTNCNIIVDREQTIKSARDLQAQIDKGDISKADIIFLDELISGSKQVDPSKVTIYRTIGAPMQSLAIAKILMKSK